MEERPHIFLRVLLAPFALIYQIIIGIRNFMYDYKLLKVHEFEIPIISIGNISVGGTGKTPHTELLIEMLLEKNYNIAVLSRGYKRKTSGYLEVQIDDDFKSVGDEPLQIKNKFPNVIVAVHENRVKGIQKLMNDYSELNVIILDDAFQHRKVKPGLSILMNDYNHSFVHDHILPFGRLRESHSSSHRAHIIFVSKCPFDMKPIERRIMLKEMDVMPYQHLFFSSIEYLKPKSLFGNKDMGLDDLKKYNVLAVTGVAKSKMFYKELTALCKSVIHLKYPDHYSFKKKDFKKIKEDFDNLESPKCIIVTEKDAMRLKAYDAFLESIGEFIYYIPIKVYLLCSEEEKQQFDNQIYSYVKNNKRYSKLYKNTNLN
jgi:tetraacyldisaccharide 4'-kinase